jgi:hypothetical protein
MSGAAAGPTTTTPGSALSGPFLRFPSMLPGDAPTGSPLGVTPSGPAAITLPPPSGSGQGGLAPPTVSGAGGGSVK